MITLNHTTCISTNVYYKKMIPLVLREDKGVADLFSEKFPSRLREQLGKWDLGASNTYYQMFHVGLDEKSMESVMDESKEILIKKGLDSSESIKAWLECFYPQCDKKIERVEKMNLTQVDMSFIQREFLTNPEWLYVKSLSLRGCFDETLDNDTYVSDEYRKAMAYIVWRDACMNYTPLHIDDVGKYKGLLSAEGRDDDERLMSWCYGELLVQIHAWLTIGGRYSQFEENVEPYYEATKLFYKNMVCCEKSSSSETQFSADLDSLDEKEGSLRIGSKAFRVVLENVGYGLNRSFMFVTTNPIRKTITVWYHND